MKTKKLVTAVAVVLVLCMTVAGSLAWLFDTTDEVVTPSRWATSISNWPKPPRTTR